MKEFELINHYFKGKGISRRDVKLGIGDDGALLSVPEHTHLVVTTDTLVAGVHFFEDTDPRSLGHRAVAVNLSDLAAMGAEPAWLSVALTLPTIDPVWLDEFCAGMHEICEYFNVQIVGGDTTQGPLVITICAKGYVPEDKALTRSGARNGDWIYVTGHLGDAALAIEAKKGKFGLSKRDFDYCYKRYAFPSPRVAAGQALRGLASSALDISDGLVQDLGHILRASNVGATINIDKVPMSAQVMALAEEQRFPLALAYGDDYELLFTVPTEKRGKLEMSLGQFGIKATCIGQIGGTPGKVDLRLNGEPYHLPVSGYQHFNQQD